MKKHAIFLLFSISLIFVSSSFFITLFLKINLENNFINSKYSLQNLNNLNNFTNNLPNWILNLLNEPIYTLLENDKLLQYCNSIELIDQSLQNKKTINWMENYKNILQNKSINQIKIPATHDSFSYNINFNSSILNFSNDIDSLFLKIFVIPFIPKSYLHFLMVPWSKSQNCNVLQQLINGIRYFDIRVCCKKNFGGKVDELFTCHNLLSEKIENIFKQIKKFIFEISKNEFIILDFNHFYDMTSDNHEQLIQLIKNNFDTILIKPNEFKLTDKLSKLWETNKRIFIFYSDRNTINKFNETIFSSNNNIFYSWAQTSNVNDLKLYNNYILNERLKYLNKSENLFSLQNVLTPTAFSILNGMFYKPHSLLEYSLISNYYFLNEWLPNYNKSLLNIVSTDFYQLFNFTETIINLNL